MNITFSINSESLQLLSFVGVYVVPLYEPHTIIKKLSP
jgi:hypothetical protein